MTGQEEVLKQHCVRRKRIPVFYVVLVLAETNVGINTERFAKDAQKIRRIAGGTTARMGHIYGHTEFRKMRVCSLVEQG